MKPDEKRETDRLRKSIEDRFGVALDPRLKRKDLEFKLKRLTMLYGKDAGLNP